MKSSTRYGLTSAAAFFALCVSVVACGPGGGYPSNQSYPQYPSQYSTANTTPHVPVKPVVSSVPECITVVSAESSATTDAPVGHLQLASPGTGDSTAAETSKPATVEKVVAKEEPKREVDLNKSLDSLGGVKEDTSKIAEALKGLVGTWLAVSRQGDGELSTVELQLDDHGWAKLTVPGADGKPSTTSRKVEFDNNEIKLTGADAEVMLGKLVDFNSRQMVLERSGGQVTFVRP